MNLIKMSMELMDHIENNTKTATTRKGLKTKYTLGPVKFVNAQVPEDIIDNGAEIYSIEAVDFCDLSNELAELEGYESANELKDKLISIYGPIDEYETMTVIKWYR